MFKLRYLVETFVLAGLLAGRMLAQPALPGNLGQGLRELAGQAAGLRIAALPTSLARDLDTGDLVRVSPDDSKLQTDLMGRVLVEVRLDGTRPVAQMRSALAGLGMGIVSDTAAYRGGVISAFIPLGAAGDLGRLPGVRSADLVYKPRTQVGSVTSQGAVVHRTLQPNASGVSGAGITVGVLSDSYNTASNPRTTAEDDIASGDLPPSKFLLEGPDNAPDEGRAMMQLIYDLAPQSSLCFATAFLGETSFANNIRALRANPQCAADVIVDDVVYLTEPMFSDGQVAQAVEDVVNAPPGVLPGKRVAYFSSAGNEGGMTYDSVLRMIPDSTARSLPDQELNFGSIATSPGCAAAADTGGGFHDFDPGPGTLLSQPAVFSGESRRISFQWDDPFDRLPTGVTTDLNFLVFSAGGDCLFAAAANNFLTNRPLEFVGISGSGAVRIVISRTSSGAKLARRVKYAVFGGAFEALFVNRSSPAIFGHPGASSANTIAAYGYDTLPPAPFVPLLEPFSSPGPVTIVFDRFGNRLPVPEVRKKPEMTAADGTNNTFFGFDYEGDGLPNFFGTSAAAPHAAAIAALLLQRAGGPSSLTPQQVRSYLLTSAPARDFDQLFIRAAAASGEANLAVTAGGDGANDPNFFRVTFDSPGQTLTSLTINLAPAGLVFDPSQANGFPLTIGSASPGVTVTSSPPSQVSPALTLTFSGFTSERFINFGIDRDFEDGTGLEGGNTADLLAGATVRATLAGPGPASVNGVFVNRIAKGYSVFDGFGLIDAISALNALP
ncbi:MAG: S8 family peptidase [Bryobacteraceae bacterium]